MHYEDLVDRLRTATKLPMLQALCNEAADAIEALVGAEKRKTEKDAPLTDYISREAALESVREKVLICESLPGTIAKDASLFTLASMNDSLNSIPAADVRPVPAGGIGEMSDGYHTFNGLYYQRMVLFAALVKAHKDKAWKSWKHEDGEPCFGGGWFIVGIDTPQGSYTYHYEAKDFDLFDCKELPVAKHWDGHTEKDVTRLLSLDVWPVVWAVWRRYSPFTDTYECSNCGEQVIDQQFRTAYCPNCGADMREPPKEET